MSIMEKNWKKSEIFFSALAVSAFLVNFCWESLHGLFYKAHPAMPASVYVPMMFSMAAWDTLGIMGLYFFTSLVSRTWYWIPGFRNSLYFSLSGFVAAFTVEYISLFIFHFWQYAPAMPTVFGIGLFPLLQLSFTGLFSIFVARKVAGEG